MNGNLPLSNNSRALLLPYLCVSENHAHKKDVINRYNYFISASYVVADFQFSG